VVRRLLEAAGEIPSRETFPHMHGRDTAPTTPRLPGPDWTFQNEATRRCLEELNKEPGRKVGLVLPTAGGKTRTALRIALSYARQHKSGKVTWLTHRRDLRDQAQEELQELLNAAEAGEITQEDLQIFGDRVEFLMLSELENRLAQVSDPSRSFDS